MHTRTTAAATWSAASPEAFLATRASELGELEAAALILSPILSDDELRSYDAQFEALHERIDALSSLLSGSDDFLTIAERAAAEFADVGSALSELLQRTQALIPEADLAKLRPAVRQFCATNRSDVATVLDLCLRNLDAFDDFWPLIDLIVGRLSTADCDGKAGLSTEPHKLTARLEEACAATSRMLPGATGAAAGVFQLAIEEVEAADTLEDLEPIVERVFNHKQSLGRKVLLPGVLRSSVLYNVSVANRVDALHRKDGELIESVEMDLGYVEEADEKHAAEEDARRLKTSVFEHAGVEKLEAALCARIQGTDGPKGPARMIAAGCDLSKLRAEDRTALLAPGTDDDLAALPRLLLIGLVVEQFPRIESELAGLGIDPDELADEWVPEVRGALRTQLRELIRAGRYAETRAPSGALSRLLPIWAISENARARGAKRVAVYYVATDGIDLRALLAASRDDRRVKRLWGFRDVLAASLLMIAIVMVGRVVVGPETSLKLLDRNDLAAFSEHLETAQRTDYGYGDAMAGRFADSWHELDAREQYERAWQIANDLRADGVLNVLLLDSDRRLQLQLAGGRLIYPKRP